jgi:hypothetical protein
MVTFQEEPARVGENIGLDEEHTGKCGFDSFHDEK